MKKEFFYGFSIDDIALEEWSTPEDLARILDFCAENDLKGTFFTVPVIESTDQEFTAMPGYVELLRQAHRDGHCVAQHGLRHNRFELGVPPPMVLNLAHEGPAREFLKENAAKLKAEHTVDELRRRLRQGREILERALEIPVTGFRSPALQVCPELFKALALEKYAFDSSACLQETGWDYIQGDLKAAPKEITRERFLAAQREPGLPTLPLTTDYSWFLTEDKYAATLELAKRDFLGCVAAGIPFVHVVHVTPVWRGDGDCGIRIVRELLAFMRAEAARRGFELRSENLATIAEAVKDQL